MNILVIGGCHTGNYGIQAHLSFARQWASHLEIAAQEPVHLRCLSMVKLTHIDSLVTQYRADFQAADLIMFQLGHYELSWRRPFLDLFRSRSESNQEAAVYRAGTPPKPYPATEKLYKAAEPVNRSRWQDTAKTTVLRAYHQLYKSVPYLHTFRHQLTGAFDRLAAFRDKIIVLTPFPTLNTLDYWLRSQCHAFIIDAAIERSFTVADTFDAIPRHPTFFQADGVHLNSLGHMVLSLFLSELPCVMELHREPTVV